MYTVVCHTCRPVFHEGFAISYEENKIWKYDITHEIIVTSKIMSMKFRFQLISCLILVYSTVFFSVCVVCIYAMCLSVCVCVCVSM